MEKEKKIVNIPEKRGLKILRSIALNLLFVFFCMIIAFIVTNSLFYSISIDGTSMLNTLNHSDQVVVYKLGKYKRGDIIVFESSETYNVEGADSVYLVKRIIGLPGDTVEVRLNESSNKFETYVNDLLIDEPYVHDENMGGNSSSKIKLSENEFFYMGDNRKVSRDSREAGLIGVFSDDAIVGRVIVRYVIGMIEGKFNFDVEFIKRGT
ncbi:MAG: signal peptidase I [Christensenellaceae bacterium]|jgi:signal peptidase I|nr:signal peptidase I [Christensenellaceae bacterium]